MENSVCFIGHRKINNTPTLRDELEKLIINLINDKTVNFIFGDHSAFNTLCYECVTKLKEQYSFIRRIKFRKDYEEAGDYTLELLMEGYEDNICPKGISLAGAASYVERNQAMINESEVCVFYYNERYLPKRRKKSNDSVIDYQPKSGTAVAYAYAQRKKKKVINLYTEN